MNECQNNSQQNGSKNMVSLGWRSGKRTYNRRMSTSRIFPSVC
jgi:hypothetical protein